MATRSQTIGPASAFTAEQVAATQALVSGGGIWLPASSWASQPNAASYAAGTKWLCTNIPQGGAGTLFFSDGARWCKYEYTLLAGSAVALATFTGSTTETTQVSFTLPGGLLGPNGLLDVRIRATCNNSANPHYTRFYIGSSKLMDIAPANGTYTGQSARIGNRNSQSSQLGTPQNVVTADANGVTTMLTGTADTSVDQTCTIKFWLGAVGDSMTLQSWEAWFISRT